MKIKVKKFVSCLFALSPLLFLSSCNLFIGYQTSSAEPIELGEYAGQNINLKMIDQANEMVNLDYVGDQNLLVLPVCFKDYDLKRLNLDHDQVISNINHLFFGSSEETGWESVSSFYKKSSYNHLNIQGEVSDIITMDYNLIEAISLRNSSSSYDPTYTFINEAYSKYLEKNPDKTKHFDKNNDGYVDGIWLVYLNPYFDETTKKQYINWDKDFAKTSVTNNANSVLWAYTYWNYDNKPNVEKPTPFAYSWASYSFIFDGKYKDKDENYLVDAHTFIHETGHMLGLDDYYNYDSDQTNISSPLGATDMMDNNVGDHGPYSKYLMEWISPKLVKNEGTYHLNSFEEDGSCLLVPANKLTYNNSPFDEYLLIEYYTPTNLNYLDSQSPYDNNIIMPTECGVRIYHVDSRLVKYTYNRFFGEYSYDGYTSSYINTSNAYCRIGASNTPSYSDTDKMLITLLSSKMNGDKKYYYQDRDEGMAMNEDLYQTGDEFNDFTFNTGDKLPYKVTFENQSDDGIDIVFTNN